MRLFSSLRANSGPLPSRLLTWEDRPFSMNSGKRLNSGSRRSFTKKGNVDSCSESRGLHGQRTNTHLRRHRRLHRNRLPKTLTEKDYVSKTSTEEDGLRDRRRTPG